jgi:hypothetical protein
LTDVLERQLQLLWAQTDKQQYGPLYNKFVADSNFQKYKGTMLDWKPSSRCSLTPRQLSMKNRENSVQFIKRAELDGVPFCSTEWSDGKVTDNSYILNQYNEGKQATDCYGQIQRMFIAQKCPGAADQVFIIGDWYSVVGTSPISRNVQVQHNPNFVSECITYLHMCKPVNLTLLPSCIEDDNGLFDVILD